MTALGLLCMAFTGCVEGEQTFTLNPDGSGKVSIKVVMPPFDLRSAIKQPAKESLEDMRRGMLQPLLQTLGVEAWKDVSADFTPDGHLKFSGTAYFKNYNHLEWGSGTEKAAIFGTLFRLDRKPNGSLTLTGTQTGTGPGITPGWVIRAGVPKEGVPKEIADDKLDGLIMMHRITYQQAKPANRAILTDMKLKIVYLLPGQVSQVREFQADGPTTVSFKLDGNQILADREKLMTLGKRELRSYYRGNPGDARLARYIGDAFIWDASVTVAKPTAPQFDFDKEVKEARAAYPQLRMKLKLGNEVNLPGDERKEK